MASYLSVVLLSISEGRPPPEHPRQSRDSYSKTVFKIYLVYGQPIFVSRVEEPRSYEEDFSIKFFVVQSERGFDDQSCIYFNVKYLTSLKILTNSSLFELCEIVNWARRGQNSDNFILTPRNKYSFSRYLYKKRLFGYLVCLFAGLSF